MSQDFIDPNESSEKMPTQLQRKGGNNGHRVRVLTPDMLNQFALIDKVCQSAPGAESQMETISPVKIHHSVKKIIMQKVLKSTDSSKSGIESHSPVRNIGTNRGFEETVQKNLGKYKSSVTQTKGSKSDSVQERTQIISESGIFSHTLNTVRRTSRNAQSKKSTVNHNVRQIVEELQPQEKSLPKFLPERASSKGGRSSSGLKTHQRNKSSQSSSSKMIPSDEVSQPKITDLFNKIISTSTTPVIHQNQIVEKNENTKKLSGVKINQVALLERKCADSLEPTSPSLHMNTPRTKKRQDISKLPASKNNSDEKVLSLITVEGDDITRKEDLTRSKRQCDVRVGVEVKEPAPKEHRRISSSKAFDDCLNNVSDRKSEASHTVKRCNNPNNSQVRVEKITEDTKNSLKVTRKVTNGAEESHRDMPLDIGRKRDKKNHRTVNTPKNFIGESHTIDVEKVANDAISAVSLQSLPPAHISSPSETSQTINKPENIRTKSKKNQPKIVNNTMNNSHDKTGCKTEKNEVLKNVGITHVPDLIPISASPMIEKIRRIPRKDSIAHKSPQSNSVNQNLDEKYSTMQRSNSINDIDVTENSAYIESMIKIEISAETTTNGEKCVEQSKEKRPKLDNSDAQKTTGNTVKRRGRPPKKRVVDELAESNSLNQKPENESSITLETNGIDVDPTTPELGRSRRIRRVAEIKEKLSGEESNIEESDGEDCKKRTQRRRQGGNRGRRRGRHSTSTVDTDYTPRSVESNSKSKKSEANDEKSDSIEIVCGRCNEKMAKEKWTNHNLNKHNNMGWREGDPVPDYENNEKLWRTILAVAHKRKKGSLICDKCLVTKKSVFGFISHYKFCGKTNEERDAMKWTCPQCNSVFMPSSQDFHERMHRNMENKEKLILQSLSKNGEIEGGRKRKAAERAATKISEFTALVKDEEPVTKKLRKTVSGIKDLIEESHKKKCIPAVWKSTWIKAIAAEEPAQCQQPGCTFSTSSLSEITEHYNNCKFTPKSTFTCKICKYITAAMNDMEEHVREQHASEIKGGDDSDFLASESSDESEVGEIVTKLPHQRKPTSALISSLDKAVKHEDRISFLRNESHHYESNPKMTFISALRWTLEFEYDNYCSLVFENLKPNQSTLLTHNDAKNYLPELTVSMRMQHLKDPVTKSEEIKNKIANIEWKTWNRFESSVVDGFPTFFVGGPVWAMAWLPIPTILYSQNVNQYIAISTHSKMHDSFTAGKSYKFKNLIQIWNLGDLNHSLSHTPQNPQLVYAIAHEKGTIWCMEWCPSGAYENSCATVDDKKRNSSPRMGLLAIAASDGCVHIYSITFPDTLDFKKTEESQLPIYTTDPVVTLQFNQLYHEKEEINWQCTTLNWSKMDSHDIIAAGFSNGYVALWDLSTKSPLLVTQNNATLCITSYRYFFAHRQAVTGITIIPLRGRRFLATVSVDRYAKFWDLEDLSDCVSSVKKGMTVNSTWMTHWPNIIAAYDDVLGLGHTTSYMIGLRESCSKAFPLLPTNSPCFGLAASDYANGISHGTSAGELVAIFPLQMFYYRDLEREKLNRKRWLVSSVEVVDFEAKSPENAEKVKGKNNGKSKLKEYVYMPDTYEECSRRFGMVFHNDINNLKKKMMKKSDRKSPLNSETMKTVPVEQYNFTSINRISWNPNAWSYLWLAVGYQNGLIRVLHLKSMSMQNAIMGLLPAHVKKQLKKESGKKYANSI